MALDNTGHFNYQKTEVNSDDSVTIWYIPKNTDQSATLTTLAEVLGAYVGVARITPGLSDLYIKIGSDYLVTGELYCLRSWVPTGEMTTEESAALVLKVLGTFKQR